MLHDNAVGNLVPPLAAEIGVVEIGFEVGDRRYYPLAVVLLIVMIIFDEQFHHLSRNVTPAFLRRWFGFFRQKKKTIF